MENYISNAERSSEDFISQLKRLISLKKFISDKINLKYKKSDTFILYKLFSLF